MSCGRGYSRRGGRGWCDGKYFTVARPEVDRQTERALRALVMQILEGDELDHA